MGIETTPKSLRTSNGTIILNHMKTYPTSRGEHGADAKDQGDGDDDRLGHLAHRGRDPPPHRRFPLSCPVNVLPFASVRGAKRTKPNFDKEAHRRLCSCKSRLP
jgi:hypothetical protein